jgi:hypothetical protein
MNHLIGPVIRPLTILAERSQRGACRNAMVASTALAARRRERDEVQEYLDQESARRAHRAGAALLPHSADALPAAGLG